MKERNFQSALAVAVAGCVFLLGINAMAEDSPGAPAAVQMTPNVAEIVKLAQAKVSDDTIIAYVKNAGESYDLTTAQIIYLHQHGIPDAVITAMLNQPKLDAAPATAPTSTLPPAVSTTTTILTDTTPLYSPRQKGEMPAATVTTNLVQISTAKVAPAVTYVQVAPPYYYQPYYYPYNPPVVWPFPPVSLSFGWGGHWRGGWHR